MHLDVTPRLHHDGLVRTKLTLEPDVQRLVEDEMHRRRAGRKTWVNEALRQALTSRLPVADYEPPVHHSGLAPGVDPLRLNQLADELEDEELPARLSMSRGLTTS